jgi:multidrug efflux pump subunit AcrB
MVREKNNSLMGMVETFLRGKLSLMLIIISLIFGIGAIIITPREEEPQIVVPAADIFVGYPGASANEVEKLVSSKLEKLLWEIDGVEYVYSTSYKNMAVITVRFFVNEDRERSLVKLYNKIDSNIDQVIPKITSWVVKPIEIDDVPIVTFSLFSEKLNDHELRRIADEVNIRLAEVEDISKTYIIGGRQREIRVELDLEKTNSKNLSMLQIYNVLNMQDQAMPAGEINSNNRVYSIKSGPFFKNIDEVKNIVVGVFQNKSVKLSDVATIIDGKEEVSTYTRIGFGTMASEVDSKLAETGALYPSVTIGIAKKKGTNAVNVSKNVIAKMEELKKEIIPSDVSVVVTRDNGKTANDKVNELLYSLLFAMIGVVTIIGMSMSWREAFVVAFAVPITFALSLFLNYLFGYTINRVTLFALILTLGMVVDNPITIVDNIQRHMALRHKNGFDATLAAVKEILGPIFMSTLAIIMSFIPMFYITGMMGPYMSPMAINVPLAIGFSFIAAITFVPWKAYMLLKNKYEKNYCEDKTECEGANQTVQKIYKNFLSLFLDSKLARTMLFSITILLFGLSAMLIVNRKVPLKILPFDNKNEFQVVIDPKEGTTLEDTDKIVREVERYLMGISEVTSFQSYVGIASPMDFNSMMRHYYLRKGNHFADIRVNIVQKDKRKQQSHEIVLRIRDDIQKIALKNQVSIKLVELAPGPPVFSTVVAEIYGDSDTSYEKLQKYANIVKSKMETEKGVVDVDSTLEDEHYEYTFTLDREKASLHGIAANQVNMALRLALSGLSPAEIHTDYERESLKINLRLNEEKRSNLNYLENIKVMSMFTHKLISIGEIGSFSKSLVEQPIYHKNLKRVIFVTAETAGKAPAEAVLDLKKYFKENPVPKDIKIRWDQEGEWKITLDVFRDLGIAFMVALIGIYLLLVIETNSFFIPIIIMLSIPLTAIGIIPGFYLLNLITNSTINGYANPVFFTATAMIGMIALGGIVVRNSIVLIDFINEKVKEGVSFKEAILKSGAVRFKPIMLTSATTMLGAWPITQDPVFSGLAWSLIFGLFASTAFTIIIVPTAYYMIFKKKYN